MDFLKNQKLSTKLIGSFVLLAILAGLIAYVAQTLSFQRLRGDTIPTLQIEGQLSRLLKTYQTEVLEFVALGEEETVAEVAETSAAIEALLTRFNDDLTDDAGEDQALAEVARLATELTALGQGIVEAHQQNLQNLAELEAVEDKAEEIFTKAQTALDEEIAEHIGEENLADLTNHLLPEQGQLGAVKEQVRVLELETIEFITTDRTQSQAEVEEAQAKLVALIESYNEATVSHHEDEAEIGEALNQITAELTAKADEIVASHSQILEQLEELESVESQLEEALTAAQNLIDTDIEQGVTEANWRIVISAGMLLGVASVIGLVITGSIIGPLTKLVEATGQLGAGKLDTRAPVLTGDEVGQLAQAFNQMAGAVQTREAQLQQLTHRLEARTRAVETSASISQEMTTVLDVDELLQQVVNRLKDEFEFYHAHIYLVEEETGELVMATGAGEVGQKLKAKGHRLAQGQGIVGTVAGTKQPFKSDNVDAVLNFVRNPLLPKTRSELALPMLKGDQVLGVLDIQSEALGRFSNDDIALLQSLANQTAIAIDNARLLDRTQAALREVERLNRRLIHEAWTETKEKETIGYHFKKGLAQAISKDSRVWLPPMKEAAAKKELVKVSDAGNGHKANSELAVPLMLRGEVIGVLGVKREEKPDWAAEEVSAVAAVADQISRALENARLAKEQEKTIEQLKEIDRLKSEFLTSMSHELRTPLNSIIGFADVLLQGIDGDLPDLAMGDIKLIHNSGQHLLALINDILDLSKIEAGKMELVREPLDVAEVIDDVLAASTSLVKSKPVEIKVDRPASLPLIYADKLRLSQVLLNLMSNAAKFTERGSITIKASIVEQSPDQLRIAVIDTGIGIAESKLGAIFDRFRQADSSTTRKYGGTGLGLAIALNLTEMHGGELKVKSQEGVGSEFYFTVPLADSIKSDSEAATVV